MFKFKFKFLNLLLYIYMALQITQSLPIHFDPTFEGIQKCSHYLAKHYFYMYKLHIDGSNSSTVDGYLNSINNLITHINNRHKFAKENTVHQWEIKDLEIILKMVEFLKKKADKDFKQNGGAKKEKKGSKKEKKETKKY